MSGSTKIGLRIAWSRITGPTTLPSSRNLVVVIWKFRKWPLEGWGVVTPGWWRWSEFPCQVNTPCPEDKGCTGWVQRSKPKHLTNQRDLQSHSAALILRCGKAQVMSLADMLCLLPKEMCLSNFGLHRELSCGFQVAF